MFLLILLKEKRFLAIYDFTNIMSYHFLHTYFRNLLYRKYKRDIRRERERERDDSPSNFNLLMWMCNCIMTLLDAFNLLRNSKFVEKKVGQAWIVKMASSWIIMSVPTIVIILRKLLTHICNNFFFMFLKKWIVKTFVRAGL